MSESDPKPEPSPEMRRAVSRRGFLTGEVKDAGMKAVKQLPAFGGILGSLLRETADQRDERLVENLWQLLMGRKPKPEENAAGLELVKKAQSADEKGDALVDILWALCQTGDFDKLQRPTETLVRGLYLLAQDREPTEDEKRAALTVINGAMDTARRTCEEAEEGDEAAQIEPEDAAAAARVAALEGLFSGLLRANESVLRKQPGGPKRSFFGG